MNNSGYKIKDFNELILFAQNDDIKALEEILRRIQKDVYGIFTYLAGAKHDINDLTQEALLKIARSIHSLKEPKLFKSWQNHIIANVFFDYMKKRAKESKVEINDEKLLEIKDKIGCEPGEKCLFSEMDRLIKAALLELPYNLRIVIVLREFEGLSYEDISKVTNTTLGTVKSRIARARLKLQKELKEFI